MPKPVIPACFTVADLARLTHLSRFTVLRTLKALNLHQKSAPGAPRRKVRVWGQDLREQAPALYREIVEQVTGAEIRRFIERHCSEGEEWPFGP